MMLLNLAGLNVVRQFRRSALLCALLPLSSYGLQLTAGPEFWPAPKAPLAGLLVLATDEYSRINVMVEDGESSWQHQDFTYTNLHAMPVLGFKPGRTNFITVIAHDAEGHQVAASEPLRFVTAPLPADFPVINVLESKPERMEPGYTLFRVMNNNTLRAYIGVVNHAGAVVWYSGIPTTSVVRPLPNGNLFIPLVTNFVEVNMLGETVKSWKTPPDLKINLHDGVPTERGSILYLSDASELVPGFPTSVTNPNAPRRDADVLYNRVVEMSPEGAVLHTHSLLEMLDPWRINYLTFSGRTSLGWDIQHANALIEDPTDDSVIVSMRHQDAVVKFSRATGQLKWILGPHENWPAEFQKYLLKPVGEQFEWNYAQHAPTLTPHGTLLLYDNGNYRASPFNSYVANVNNFSRAVEFRINERTMEIEQVWEYGRHSPERLFTDRVGNVEWQPRTGNVLINFGYTIFVNGARPSPRAVGATMARIKEVTHEANPEVVFDLALFDYANTNASYRGYFTYRSHRIADLYPVATAQAKLGQMLGNVARQISRPDDTPLLATLAAALDSMERGQIKAAVNQLRTFQLKLDPRTIRLGADAVKGLFYQAQGLIDQLEAGA